MWFLSDPYVCRGKAINSIHGHSHISIKMKSEPFCENLLYIHVSSPNDHILILEHPESIWEMKYYYSARHKCLSIAFELFSSRLFAAPLIMALKLLPQRLFAFLPLIVVMLPVQQFVFAVSKSKRMFFSIKKFIFFGTPPPTPRTIMTCFSINSIANLILSIYRNWNANFPLKNQICKSTRLMWVHRRRSHWIRYWWEIWI